MYVMYVDAISLIRDLQNFLSPNQSCKCAESILYILSVEDFWNVLFESNFQMWLMSHHFVVISSKIFDWTENFEVGSKEWDHVVNFFNIKKKTPLRSRSKYTYVMCMCMWVETSFEVSGFFFTLKNILQV